MARSGRALAGLGILSTLAAAAAWALQFSGPVRGLTWLPDHRVGLTGLAIASLALYGVFLLLDRWTDKMERRVRGLPQLQIAASLVVLLVFFASSVGDASSTILSVSIVGFGLTLALQRPILALAGWATVFFGRMFREGDRIAVGDLTGDVLDISLMTTRLWEVGQPGSNTPGRPTGRVRIVSNAIFLEQPVANATSDTPTVFDEFVVNVAFESDQELAKSIMREVSDAVLDLGKHKELAQTYRKLTRGLPMEKNFPDKPSILAESKPSWMEYRLRYLVDARRAGAMQSQLTEAWNSRCSEHPEQIIASYPRSQAMRIGGSGRPLDP